MGSFSNLNKVFIVRFYDKYGNQHNCAYANKSNADKRYAEETANGRRATFRYKRRYSTKEGKS